MEKEVKEIVKKLAKIFTEIESTSNSTQIMMCMDDAEGVIEDFANEHFHHLNVIINELGNDLSDSEEEAERYLVDIKFQKEQVNEYRQSTIDVSRKLKEAQTELKESNTWVSVDRERTVLNWIDFDYAFENTYPLDKKKYLARDFSGKIIIAEWDGASWGDVDVDKYDKSINT